MSVLCRYNSMFGNKKKSWCRFKDQRCISVGRSEAPFSPHTQVKDDRSGALGVEMVRVKKTDTGWYWCAVGDLQVPVHLRVTNKTEGKKNPSVTLVLLYVKHNKSPLFMKYAI